VVHILAGVISGRKHGKGKRKWGRDEAENARKRKEKPERKG
jgi:hypothetical protein